MRRLLLPFSLVWGCIIFLRNRLYDKGWLRSFEFDFPILLVGNLSAGGTGKTPHVEYLIRLISAHKKVATLSRGYKRTTKGYALATDLSLTEDIGDEPKLFRQKYPATEVAVDENRVEGIYYLLNDEPDVQAVIMDDGFQHRRIKPGFNILLTAYDHLFFKDWMLPAGHLREPRSGYKRAQVIVVTKCPESLLPEEKDKIRSQIGLLQGQHLFFTTLAYGKLYPLFPDQEITNLIENIPVLLLTGIADNRNMLRYLQTQFGEISVLSYSDHHYYTAHDISTIKTACKSGVIITTEKDAMRLMENAVLLKEAGLSVFVLPVAVRFLENAAAFDELVLQYIASYGDVHAAGRPS